MCSSNASVSREPRRRRRRPRKLGHIAEVLAALRPLKDLSLDEYRAKLYERKAAERLLQEGIEAALAINAVLAAIGTMLEIYPQFVNAIEAYVGRLSL